MTIRPGDLTPTLIPARRHVVVVLDDDPETLRSIRRLLGREPYELRTTSSPDEALRWIEEVPVSLVVSDYGMPQMRGTEVLVWVRESSPRTVCMILTAYGSRGLEQEALKPGIKHFFEKPWDDDDLRRTILQPKLVTYVRPAVSIMRVPGLMLRCRTPRRWT